mgnify:CR=1 FL=1
MAEQFTTAFGVITTASGTVFGVLVGDQIYEGQDPLSIGPVVGDAVLVDWLPSSGQWVIVAIVT